MVYDLNHGMSKLFKIVLISVFSTLLSASTIMDFDVIKKGKENNNTLLVIGGIQGDEPGGFMSASLLSTHYEITKGSVWVVPNLNFLSIIERSRGPYGDMNRKFADLPKEDPEYENVQKIKALISDDNVKLIVNLHDGSGYYRHKFEDKLHSPLKWGQCSIIDQSTLNLPKYGNLKEMSEQVVAHVNKHLLKDEDIYHVHNTRTVEGDKEMEKSLTYFAINHGKAAFGNEASKDLPTYGRVYYHLLALEKYMTMMGIEFKRKFKLTANGVYHAINNDIYVSFYDNKIKLPLSKMRNILKYFPIKKGSEIDFESTNPLVAVIKKGNTYNIQYGNRHLSKLSVDYMEYDNTKKKVKLLVDGKLKDYSFGTIIDVHNNFLVKKDDDFRVNVIGYKNVRRVETDIKIKKSQILQRYSIDKAGQIYRVEYYNKKKFAGMILVKFKNKS